VSPSDKRGAERPERDSLASARTAFAAHDWAAAYEEFAAFRDRDVLTADDLHSLGESAWWLGRIDACLEAFEAAYQRFLADDQPIPAAMSAFYLAVHSMSRGDAAQGSGWLARARRLVDNDPETAPYGYLFYVDTFSALGGGKLDEAETLALRMGELGRRLEDPNLAALGVLGRGRVLVKKGQVGEGMALLDDAMLEAMSGRLDPTWAGTIYCHLMDVCHELADVRRAAEWTHATSRWCETIPDANLYPGICRVHRAQVMQVQGDWDGAESEADRACRDMLGVHVGTVAGGQYELGDLRRLRGDFAGAEEAFKRAHELGRDPQPGLALLRLMQGRIDLAVASMRAALGATSDPLARARLCGAHVEIALAAGDIDAAGASTSELEQTAAAFSSPGLQAAAKGAMGAVLLARGQAKEALVELREACRRWQEIEAPYEEARTRLLLADAYRALADEDAVLMELDAADAVFRRLGADWDSRTVTDRRGSATPPAGLTQRELEVLQLVAAGRSNREIAAELFLSERTVHRHMSNILAKLEVPSRVAATAFAYEHGLTAPQGG
jgi:ATP/maltotriose-dependent transcriptional regulator MalT